MNRDQRNPLRDGAGKGDAPKNCHNPKFRDNYTQIDWGKSHYDRYLDKKIKEFIKRKKK